jgi:uncharacterized membrane protein
VTDSDVLTHLEEAARTIAQLRTEHHQKVTPLQRAVDRMTALLGRPQLIGVLTVIIIGWIGVNLLAVIFGYRPIDPPPFSLLAHAVSLVSFYIVVLILIAQRREDQFSQHYEQLVLELVILSEQKTAKVIQLLEEARRDNPHIHNGVDQEADETAQAADPSSVLNAIKDIRADEEQIGASGQPFGGARSSGIGSQTSAGDSDARKP